MSTPNPTDQPAADRQSAEAELDTWITRFAPTHRALISAIRTELRLPTAHGDGGGRVRSRVGHGRNRRPDRRHCAGRELRARPCGRGAPCPGPGIPPGRRTRRTAGGTCSRSLTRRTPCCLRASTARSSRNGARPMSASRQPRFPGVAAVSNADEAGARAESRRAQCLFRRVVGRHRSSRARRTDRTPRGAGNADCHPRDAGEERP